MHVGVEVLGLGSAHIVARNQSAMTSDGTSIGVTLAFNTVGWAAQNLLNGLPIARWRRHHPARPDHRLSNEGCNSVCPFASDDGFQICNAMPDESCGIVKTRPEHIWRDGAADDVLN